MNFFDFKNYKDIIHEKISENSGLKAYKTSLATQMGCQKSFFSQVLSTHIHFTPDHIANLSEFWGLSDSEADYFMNLLLYARAGNASLKKYLKKKIDQLAERQGHPSERISWPTLDLETASMQYYSSWFWSAIHIIVSNPNMTSTEIIARHLQLPQSLVKEVLTWLEEKKLIVKSKKGWNVTSSHLHLSAQSPMHETHQCNWLHRAIADLQLQKSNSLHYSSIFTVDEDTFNSLKRSIVDHIEKMSKKISQAPSEKLICLSTHLFEVGN